MAKKLASGVLRSCPLHASRCGIRSRSGFQRVRSPWELVIPRPTEVAWQAARAKAQAFERGQRSVLCALRVFPPALGPREQSLLPCNARERRELTNMHPGVEHAGGGDARVRALSIQADMTIVEAREHMIVEPGHAVFERAPRVVIAGGAHHVPDAEQSGQKPLSTWRVWPGKANCS